MPGYREADWFGVPLRTRGYAFGLLARDSGDGVLLGYFFGPRGDSVPTMDGVTELHAQDAVLVAKFGHLGLKGGTWPIIGRQPDWDRAKWPMPVFSRFEELTGRWWEVRYDENNPNKVISETLIQAVAGDRLPRDGVGGPGFVEVRLTRIFDIA